VVALPTETVYGLAANAFNADAVAQIFQLKGRPATNPVIIHVTGVDMAKRCVAEWPPLAGKLATAFWPGPLTLVLPRSPTVPDIVTANGDTVGVRWPSHPFMQAVIRACGFPLAAPSANLSNEVSPTNAEHVQKTLGEKLRMIIDGGQSQIGIESTVLDLTVDPPVVLRPGMIHAPSLLAVTGTLGERGTGLGSAGMKSPGLLPKHYSPKSRLEVWKWQTETELQDRIAERGLVPRQVRVISHQQIPHNLPLESVIVMAHDPEAFARALYAEWHRSDEQGVNLIVVEAPPTSVEWQAIADRLARAASHVD
jgi:L-threonylcarbamoyladenylate synthase